MPSSIADIRKDYRLKSLNEKDADANAIRQFDVWWQEALRSEITEVNAMTVATVNADGTPYARIILLKGFDERGFVFFTNYESIKGKQLVQNSRVCLIFFWKELERQVRIIGEVEKLTTAENDEYFNSRPEGSRIGAWVSPQSQVIDSREWLEERKKEYIKAFTGKQIQRPPHWGGYRVKPVCIEFWQGGSNRLHDRLQYTLVDGSWKIERLAP